MALSKFSKLFWVITMVLMMSHLPHVAFGEVARGMISTTDAVELLSRADAEAKVRSYLDNAELMSALEKQGLSSDEVSSRIASLSQSELNALAKQMDQARYGGDALGGILVTVLLIVLIIYLVKRI